MLTSRAKFSCPVSIMVILMTLVGLTAYESFAIRNTLKAAPVAAGVVNLEVVFAGLTERARADANLQQMADALQVDSEKQSQVIKDLAADLEDYPPGSDKYQQVLEEYSLKTLEYQAFIEFSRQKISIEKSLIYKRIYQSIRDSVSKIAKEDGYQLILVDDGVGDLPPVAEAEMVRQISARKVLYADTVIDLTEKLLARMNQAVSSTTPSP
jgi:Skp family chaperone for outer membrane proteins